MAITYAKNKQTSSARLKVVLSALIGVLVAVLMVRLGDWRLAPILGWDTAAIVYLVWEWLVISRLSGKDTAAHAVREDPSRAISGSIVLSASVASLVTVALVLTAASSAQGAHLLLDVLLGVVSVVVAWMVVHTLYTLRYAGLTK